MNYNLLIMAIAPFIAPILYLQDTHLPYEKYLPLCQFCQVMK